MTNLTKEFISYTIDLIEEQDWHELFTVYRNEFANHEYTVDNETIQELFNVLAEIGIDAENLSIEARKEIIFQDYLNIVDDAFNNKGYTHARFVFGTRLLKSRLGFSLSELKDIWVEVGKAIGKSMDKLTIWNRD